MDLLEETIACTMANASGVTAMVMQLLVTHSHYAVEWVFFLFNATKISTEYDNVHSLIYIFKNFLRAVNTTRKVKIVKNVHLASMEIR